MDRRLIYLGGNGHCAARLAPARTALSQLVAEDQVAAFDLADVPYPGFEGRPRAPDLEHFLSSISTGIQEHLGRTAFPGRHPGPTAQKGRPTEVFLDGSGAGGSILYGTGIGGLLALCLRARGDWTEVPLLLQAPVLWGLEHRLMPRIMRLALARRALGWVFGSGWFQRHFVARQFERPLAPEMRAAFFAGYANCAALPDLFAWVTPRLLRRLEGQFAANPERLRRIGIWWGGRDRVVNLQELAWTEKALGTRWPIRTFPRWGHYPMIDEPQEWVRAVSDVLATPGAIPGPNGPEAE